MRPARWLHLPLLWLPLCVPPAAAGAPTEVSTLETVKKDLSNLPEARTGLGQPRIQLPRIDAPAAPAAGPSLSLRIPDAARNRGQTEDSRDASRNWLVEAMRERTPANGRGRKAAGPGNKENVENGLTADGNDAPSRPPTGVKMRDTDPSSVSANLTGVENPLLPYMSAWISRRDQSLLTSNQGPLLPESMGSLVTDGSMSARAADLSHVERENGRPGIAAASYRAGEENPYLSAPAGLESAKRDRDLLTVPSAAAPDRDERIEADVSQPAVRREGTQPLAPAGLAQPSQDAKYYPQLKRF